MRWNSWRTGRQRQNCRGQAFIAQTILCLSGNDFTLDIINPTDPKIVCMGNNPQNQQIYGAVLPLYISRMIKLVNKKDQLPCSLIFDEFPTIYFNGIDGLIATARSNRVATTLAIQDISQLKKDYDKEQADVIMNKKLRKQIFRKTICK